MPTFAYTIRLEWILEDLGERKVMKCPICETFNRPGVIICENCHNDLYAALLEQVSTKQLDKARERTLKIDKTMPSSNPIVVYIRNAPEPIAISRSGQLVFGRGDNEDPSIIPDIDLQPFDAQDQGVSREHLVLNAGVHPPTVADLDSYNGSFINGERLTPQEPYALQSGDEVRVGRLIMRIFYDG